MEEVIIKILTPTFIVSGVFSLLVFFFRNLILEKLKNAVKHDYDRKLRKFESELNTRTQIELASLTNRLSMELEIVKTKVGPYSEKQFELYNELWVSLCDLKYSMLQLWNQASEEKFDEFSKKLEKTTVKLENSALVVEESHYNKLIGILNTFAEYEMGKRSLIDYRKEQSIAPYDHQMTKKMIDDNKATKKQLLDYLPQLRSCLQNQINGRNIGEHS